LHILELAGVNSLLNNAEAQSRHLAETQMNCRDAMGAEKGPSRGFGDLSLEREFVASPPCLSVLRADRVSAVHLRAP